MIYYIIWKWCVASGIQTGSAVSDNEIRKCQKREMLQPCWRSMLRCLRLMPWRPADTHKLNLGSHSKAASPEGLGLSAGSFGTFANEHPQLRNSDHVWPKMSRFWWNLSCCLEVACSLAVSWPQAAPKTRPDSVHGWSQKFMQCSSRQVLRPAMKGRRHYLYMEKSREI